MAGETDFQTVPLTGVGTLPAGSTLRAVLDGTHTISDADTTAPSGAAVGWMAEKAPGTSFLAVDFFNMEIEAFGNEIAATTEAEAEAPGTAGADTVIYTGPAADIALHPTVENFDGSGAAGGFNVIGTPTDNVITTGAGQHRHHRRRQRRRQRHEGRAELGRDHRLLAPG